MPSSPTLSLTNVVWGFALFVTTLTYANVVTRKLRERSTQLQKEVERGKAQRDELLAELEAERQRTAKIEEEKRAEAEFWWRMDSLARTELSKKEQALKKQDEELVAQREQIRDLQNSLRRARSLRQDPSEPTSGGRLVGLGDTVVERPLPDVRTTIATFDEVILHMVRTLNLEISEVATQVTNSFHVGEAPEPDRFALAFERACEAMGPVMAELLETIQHQDDPILIDIALKADVVGFAAEIVSAWDFQHQSKSVFTGVYKQMLRLEPHIVAGQWRSYAQKYSKQRLYNGRDLATGFAHQLAERIADLLTVAGAVITTEAIYTTYATHLETIVRTSLELQRIIGEDVISCDYEVLMVHFDEVFDAEQMDDIYGGEVAMTGPPGMVPRVLSTADLGLRRVEKLAGSTEGDMVVTMLLKPKVVLDTIVYELGLVDDEEPSPSAQTVM
ncbi:hypothetical protein BN946_scf184943.g21 [Trametes cinnabarina]|uniref:Uncharacterized protein n=1 Tax=Pycnoporus cinnabarinus TaxID=5643 RepID=A0A060SBU7_PYCCI|nr:hypothetical protein BN946_scf184943.g21 [Trametes cinnabarina]